MRKFLLLKICMLLLVAANAQTISQIGYGTSVPGNTLYAPIYRYSSTTTTDFARSNILYVDTQLAAAGVLPGAIITKLAFYKANAGATLGNANFSIWMNNSSTVAPLATTTTWATISSTYTQVYSSTTQTIPATTGWIEFTLSTPIIYTGGSLEIAFDWDCYATTPNPTTDAFAWQYTPGYATYIIGSTSTTTAPTTLSATVAAYKERPNIRIYHTTASQLDASLSGTIAPICQGSSPITINIQNGAGVNLDSATINWSVNGMPQTPYHWIGSLATGQSAAVNLGNYTFNTGNAYDIQAIIVDVNGLGPDTNPLNDTLTITNYKTSLSGTYTINQALATTGTNYHSFNDFVTDLTNVGVCGPVVANVVSGSGPYLEHINIPQVNGASAINTITINGNGETLTDSLTISADRAMIKLNGADHITVDSLNIVTDKGSYGVGVQFFNDADSNTISHCHISINNSSTSTNYAGIIMTSSETSPTAAGATNCDGNTITGNTITGGYYSITMVGNGTASNVFNNVITNNKLLDFYSYGIYLNGNDGTLIEDNDISRPTRSSVTTFYAIYFTSASINCIVSANRIHNPFDGNPSSTSSAYGVEHTGCDATLGNENIVKNNLIYAFNGAGTQNGLLNVGSDYVKYYHNTIALDDVAANCSSCATRGFYEQTSVATGLELKDNIVYITRSGGGEAEGFYFSITGISFVSDNNDFYINNGGAVNNVGYYNGAAYTTLADWTAATFTDSNSVSIDPLFANAIIGDYTPSSAPMDDKGVSVGVTTDITGAARSLTTPDIGAYEFAVSGNDVAVNAISINNCAGTDSVRLTIQNFGATTLNTVKLYAMVNGVPTSLSGTTFTVGLIPGATADVSVGTTTFVAGNTYTVVAYPGSPNGGADGNSANDTATITKQLGLSGSYTINSAVVTGGTNFQSFTDAANYLNTNGICGAVVFDVVPASGPYNEQVSFDNINGSSVVNTVRINGNGETLSFAPTAGAMYILRINGADYFTVSNLHVMGTDATYGYGIELSNDANYDSVVNCTIDLSAITSTSSSNSAGICISASATSPIAAGLNANNCVISNNTITGGATGGPYYGIALTGNTNTTGCANNIIYKNTITDFYNNGIRLISTLGTRVISNDLSRPTITTAGVLEGIYLTGTSNPLVKILKNRVHNSHGGNPTNTSASYPIDVSSDGGGVNREILVANNAVYDINNSGTCYAFYISGSLYSNFYHNSVSLENTTATGTNLSRGFYVLGTSDTIKLINNVVSITRGGTGVMTGIYMSSSPTVWTSDHNDIYVNSPTGTNYFGYKSATQLTLADWQTATSQDANSFSVDPLYSSVANGDLSPSLPALNDQGQNLITVVPDDILGNARTTTPDPGAFEFTPNNNDAGVSEIMAFPCAGTDSLRVRVQNLGVLPLTSVTVYATVDGVPTPASGTTYTVNITTGNDVLLNLGAVTFAPNTTPQIVAFTSAPNGSTDGNNANDTLTNTVNLSLAGNYTINSAVTTGGINFQTFTDAATALNLYGVCGPVVFNVVPGSGPYTNQQFELSNVAGTSATNTITYKGNNELFTFLATVSANRAGIRITNTNYVTIDSLIINSEGNTTSQYGIGVQILDRSDYNTISNCTIYVDTATTSTNYAGVSISGSTSSATGTGNNGNYNTVINNIIRGGYYGVAVVGSSSTTHNTGNSIINNTVSHFYYYGLYNYYQDTVTITGNTVVQRVGGSSTCYGVYPYYNNYITVTKNKIVTNAATSNYALEPYYCYASAATPNLIANNFVSALGGAGTTYGIYPYNNYYTNIYHNSVLVTGGSTTAGRAFYINSSTSGGYGFVNVLNNIGVNTSTGLAVELSSGAVTLGYVTSMQNNDWYSAGVNLGTYSGSVKATLAAWTAASGFDSSSISLDPLFVSNTDLHVGLNFLNDRGATGTGIADDIDGDVRCPYATCAGSTLRPDIGADEFLGTPITVDMGVENIVSPVQQSCYSNAETVTIRIHNYNSQDINFAVYPVTVYASATGVNPTVFTPILIDTGSLQADSTMLLTFSTSYDMSQPGTYTFSFYTSQASDGNNFNDSLLNANIVFNVGALPVTYTELCAGNSIEIRIDGVNGPVQWQAYDDINSTWVNETGAGNDSVAYVVSPSSTTLYRALVCSAYPSATDTIVPLNLVDPTVMMDTICGPGTASITAMGLGTQNWYAGATGGNVLFSGDTFNVAVTADTTFYVESTITPRGGNGLVKITEIDLGTYDAIEIENLSSQTISTAGWFVGLSNSYTDINLVNTLFWNLPATLAPGQIIYTTDQTSNNYWGNNILWNPGSPGWVVLMDNSGTVQDFVIWDWDSTQVAGINTTVNGHPLTATNNWVGTGIDATSLPGTQTFTRIGISDHNNLADFVRANSSINAHNANLATVFSGGACVSNRVPVSVTVNPVPIVNLGADTIECTGGTVVLDAGNAGLDYTWSTSETTQTITVSSSGAYSVSVADAAGCVGTDAINVTISTAPIVDLGADTTQCGGAVSLDAGNAGGTYLWSTSATTQMVTVNATANYSVTVTNADGCKAADSISVNINPLPVVDLGADTAVCGGPYVLDAGNPGSTYLWNDNTTAQTLSVTAGTATYTVVVTSADGCTATDAVDVTIKDLPVVDLGNDTAQCAGTVTLDAGNAGASYLWNDNTTAQTLTVSATGTYRVQVTADGCSATDSVDVTINTLPVVDLGADTTLCGGPYVLDAGNPGGTYTWNDNTTAQTLAATATGTYSVVVTNTDGCTATDAVNVTINTLPVITFNLADTVCINAGNVTLSATPTGGAFSGTGVTGTTFNPVTAGAGAHTVTYAYTDGNGCANTHDENVVVDVCTGIEDVAGNLPIQIYPNPSSGIINISLPANTYSIYDIRVYTAEGKLVIAHSVAPDNGNNIYTVDMSDKAKGMYVVKVITDKATSTARIVIQ